MKEITGKSKLSSNIFPKSINVHGRTMKKNSHIAEEVNTYGQQDTKRNTSNTFEDFLIPREKNTEYKDLTFEEFEKDSVKRNKAAGHVDFDSNVTIKVYDEISYPLFFIFHSYFSEGIFLEQLKVAKVSRSYQH